MKYKTITSFACILALACSLPALAQQAPEASDCPPGQVFSVIPAVLNNTGPGAGISYEHELGPQNRASFNAAVYGTYGKSKWHYGDFYRTVCVGTLLSFKYYTSSCQKKVRHAIGFGIPLDILSRKTTEGRSPGGYSAQNKTDIYFRTGLVVHNSLQVSVSRRIAIGLDANLGFGGSDEKGGDSFAPLALLFASVGYRL
jgi:hypothetical protein